MNNFFLLIIAKLIPLKGFKLKLVTLEFEIVISIFWV